MTRRFVSFTLVAFALSGAVLACDRLSEKTRTDDAAPPTVVSGVATVPPVAFTVTPVGAFADASFEDPNGLSPYETAKVYESRGQYMLARLVLEKKALSADGTPREIELLATLCNHQGDPTCVAACSSKLGRKLTFDGGLSTTVDAGGQPPEPETDFTRARRERRRRKRRASSGRSARTRATTCASSPATPN
jgi:hypothetical protein